MHLRFEPPKKMCATLYSKPLLCTTIIFDRIFAMIRLLWCASAVRVGRKNCGTMAIAKIFRSPKQIITLKIIISRAHIRERVLLSGRRQSLVVHPVHRTRRSHFRTPQTTFSPFPFFFLAVRFNSLVCLSLHFIS